MSTPDQPDGYPGEEAPESGRGPGQEAGPTEQDETQLLQNINNFYGQVTVEGTVGISAGARPARRSGKVDAAEIARAERCYLAPDAQSAAAARLRDSHVVFLVGPEGSGRAAGSLMLARQFRRDGCAVVRLPPTRTLEELTGTTFRPGEVYLVQDWTPAVGDGPSAVRFDAEQLSGRLRGAGAHLVVTATRGGEATRHLSAFAVAWAPVDARRLLAHCLDRVASPVLSPADLARLTERAVQLARPARVVELAAGLVDGVDAALAAVADTDAARVAEWFDRTLPVRRTLSAAVTLAFFSGVGLRCFEQLADDLDRLMSGADPAAATQTPGVRRSPRPGRRSSPTRASASSSRRRARSVRSAPSSGSPSGRATSRSSSWRNSSAATAPTSGTPSGSGSRRPSSARSARSTSPPPAGSVRCAVPPPPRSPAATWTCGRPAGPASGSPPSASCGRWPRTTCWRRWPCGRRWAGHATAGSSGR
ncbi:hypothetical protein GCM10025734_34920 [Kitasatospora paranensis]|uniref:hypothetical protein n=1 Tax=Kitasatospora paranensis TaxID=258053 RepID=UPI0031EF8B96